MKFNNFKIESWNIFPHPCYNPQDRYGNPPETFYDLMCDDRIPDSDRVWAFAHCTLIPDNIKRFAAVRFVRETPIGDGRFFVDLLTDERSVNALEVAMRHAQGLATDEELAAAWESAWDAAWDAAASAAASAAAWAAARDAAWAAARDAAARDAAARDAVWDAAWEAQLKIIKSMIK